jgi:hypothetical protein
MPMELVRQYEFMARGDGCNALRRHMARVTICRRGGGLSKDPIQQGMVINVKTLDTQIWPVLHGLPYAIDCGIVRPPTLENMATYLLGQMRCIVAVQDIRILRVELQEYGSYYWVKTP